MTGFFPGDRMALRRMYAEAWRRHQESLPMEPIDLQIAEIVARHPEYHRVVEQSQESLTRDWAPEDGETNPFLHMGMHLAIREQVATDRPSGIARVHADLRHRLGDEHLAEHLMMECLGEALWRAQRNGIPPDEDAYIEALKRL